MSLESESGQAGNLRRVIPAQLRLPGPRKPGVGGPGSDGG